MKFALLLLTPLACAFGILVLFLYWYGRRLPEAHRESVATDLPVPPDQAWKALSNTWNVSRFGQKVEFETREVAEPRRLVRKIHEAPLPFGGTWTLELEPKESGTRVRLTEEGTIHSPLLRAMAHLFIGMRESLEASLKGIAQQVT
jgi:hypothetical protein